jgi:hypothetical protein
MFFLNRYGFFTVKYYHDSINSKVYSSLRLFMLWCSIIINGFVVFYLKERSELCVEEESIDSSTDGGICFGNRGNGF